MSALQSRLTDALPFRSSKGPSIYCLPIQDELRSDKLGNVNFSQLFAESTITLAIYAQFLCLNLCKRVSSFPKLERVNDKY